MDVRLLLFYATISLAVFQSVGALRIIQSSYNSDVVDANNLPARDDNLIPSISTPSNDTATKKYTSSSEESNSYEHANKKSESPESSESSSSEEMVIKKIKKRSLDSNQDSINTIGDQENSTTIAKQNNDNKDSTDVPDVGDVEEPSNNDDSISTTSEASTTGETVGETTVTEPVTETETEEAVTEPESESTTVTEQETTTESESASTATTDDATVAEENKGSDESESTTPKEKISSEEDENEPATNDNAEKSASSNENLLDAAHIRVNKLSDQIRLVLMQYRKIGAVILPGQGIFPEPMQLQDLKQSFSIGTVDMRNMSAYGLSNFTIEHVNTDVDRMQVYVALKMRRVVVLGNYTLKTFWSRAAGPFNVTLLDVDSEGVAEVETTTDGHLEATDSNMDMFTKDMIVDFKNMGFLGTMFQGAVGAVGDAIFNSIKPQILDRVNVIIRSDVNKKLKDFSVKFVNKISPVELAFSEGRKYVREHGYDPYNIGDHSFTIGGLMNINITDFWVEGLSKFYRVGNLSMSMDKGVIEIGVHAATQKLKGRCNWSGATFGIVKAGKTNFTVDHLQVRAIVKQSLDIRKKPQLDKLDLELGWVKVKLESPMTLNMMVEGIINAFPRLIRHIIVDTLEEPLREKIQEILDKINVESVVNDNLPRLDSFGL